MGTFPPCDSISLCSSQSAWPCSSSPETIRDTRTGLCWRGWVGEIIEAIEMEGRIRIKNRNQTEITYINISKISKNPQNLKTNQNSAKNSPNPQTIPKNPKELLYLVKSPGIPNNYQKNTSVPIRNSGTSLKEIVLMFHLKDP